MHVPANTIAIWSDLGCAWSHAIVWRLHDARRCLSDDPTAIDDLLRRASGE
jgi:hypothetical protein